MTERREQAAVGQRHSRDCRASARPGRKVAAAREPGEVAEAGRVSASGVVVVTDHATGKWWSAALISGGISGGETACSSRAGRREGRTRAGGR
jgi:hypothetical protein